MKEKSFRDTDGPDSILDKKGLIGCDVREPVRVPSRDIVAIQPCAINGAIDESVESRDIEVPELIDEPAHGMPPGIATEKVPNRFHRLLCRLLRVEACMREPSGLKKDLCGREVLIACLQPAQGLEPILFRAHRSASPPRELCE